MFGLGIRPLGLLVVVFAIAACDGNHDVGPGPIRTSSVSAIDIGPFPQATAFAPANEAAPVYILDIPSSEVFVLRGAWPGLRWVDDRTLATDLGTRIDLDRREHIFGEFDDPPALSIGRALTSPDGAWRLDLAETGDVLVNTADAAELPLTPAIRQGAAVTGDPPMPEFAWSPTGHQLAIGGGRCGDSPLNLVDADRGRTITLSAAGARVPDYAWRPDGGALAFSEVTNGAVRIMLYEVAGESMVELAPAEPAAIGLEVVGLAWNPAGSRLLFTLYSGRPCPY